MGLTLVRRHSEYLYTHKQKVSGVAEGARTVPILTIMSNVACRDDSN